MYTEALERNRWSLQAHLKPEGFGQWAELGSLHGTSGKLRLSPEDFGTQLLSDKIIDFFLWYFGCSLPKRHPDALSLVLVPSLATGDRALKGKYSPSSVGYCNLKLVLFSRRRMVVLRSDRR